MTVQLYQGDARHILQQLNDNSVNCIVTSPPYFGLRDYGVDGQMGLEQTPDEYVNGMVELFREARRILRDDGTLWLNLGDSYAARSFGDCGFNDGVPSSIKPKDLIGIPWRVAFALQTDGWYLRQDIIWHKPNPMPESVRDRCTKAHEYIFLFSKSPKYYYDHEAIKEPTIYKVGGSHSDKKQGEFNDKGVIPGSGQRSFRAIRNFKNKRSVWTVPTNSFKGAHFATFPLDLIEPCILAGCPVGGTVLDPFGGSGTTAIAAMNNNRKSILIELNPDYVEICKQRVINNHKV